MRRVWVIIGGTVVFSVFGLFSFLVYVLLASGDPNYWSTEIAEFERHDVSNPPPPGAVVFVGGREVRLWSQLAVDMAPLPVINRGFGGAQIAHVTYYISRIVKPYHPRIIVLIAGEADLSDVRGRRPEDVLNDFQKFVISLRSDDITAPVYFVSIHPSPMRASRWFGARRANALIEAYVKGKSGLHYIETALPMVDERGNIRDDLFRWDGLTLNVKGYALMAERIRPVLLREWLALTTQATPVPSSKPVAAPLPPAAPAVTTAPAP